MLALSLLSSAALLVMGVLSQEIIQDYSFGYDKTISPNSFGIPGWSMLGEGHVPQLLSDKVILTPPYGGNKRGAIWEEKNNNLQQWTADLEFRASGQDRSQGSLALWYVKDGVKAVSTDSIYSVGKFDGLALVVDTVGGVQKIRGFLSDGTVEYRNHPNVDGLAFGHCDYSYRNLGRPSKLQISSSSAGLEVKIDDQVCFSSGSVVLPHDYTFGLTASGGEPPDSFEAFKFLLSPITPTIRNQVPGSDQQILDSMPKPDDTPASQYTTSQAQFEDLHSRLYALSKSITQLFAEIQRHTQQEESRYQEIIRRLPDAQTMANVDSRLQNLDRMISNLEREVKSGDHRGQFQRLSEQIAKTHSMSENLPNTLRQYIQDHTPRIGFIVFSFIAFQCALVVAYVLYKRRRAQAPKKYL